jgi:hypothetical protein
MGDVNINKAKYEQAENVAKISATEIFGIESCVCWSDLITRHLYFDSLCIEPCCPPESQISDSQSLEDAVTAYNIANPVYHQYNIEVDGDFTGQFFTYIGKDELGNPVPLQLDLGFFKDVVNYPVCAQHDSLLYNGTQRLFISGDMPECVDCPAVAGIVLSYLSDC